MNEHVKRTGAVFLLALSFILSGCGPKTLPPAGKAPLLTVSRCSGTCEVQITPGSWTAVSTNQPIQIDRPVRTGPESFLELKSTSSGQRLLLAHNSEAAINQWVQSPPSGAGRDEVQIDL